jgi:hypothetical protein
LKDFGGSFVIQAFSGAIVEQPGDVIQLRLADVREIPALGQVLTDQAVGVLVAGSLPGAVRVGEVDLDAEPSGQFLVARHFLTLIIGQRFPCAGGHLAVELEFGHDLDQIGRNGTRQLAEVGDLALGQQRLQGLFVGRRGGFEGQDQALVVEPRHRQGDGINQIAQDIAAKGVGEIVLQRGGQGAVARADGDNAIRQGAGQDREFLDDGLVAAQDVAHRGVGVVLRDVVLERRLHLGLGRLQGGGIHPGHPAFGGVDGGAVQGGLCDGLEIDSGDYGYKPHPAGRQITCTTRYLDPILANS